MRDYCRGVITRGSGPLGQLLSGEFQFLAPASQPHMAEAKNRGYSYFDMGDTFNQVASGKDLTPNEMFNMFNVPFLRNAIEDGRVIHFSHNPEIYGGYLKDELSYLEAHGYELSAGGMTAVKVG